MDVSEYLPMFLAEAREHLQELNLAVVRIEEQPDDRETVNEIFRIAHSLKGMSATMGFAGMAALTHQMEDVFELLRQRGVGLSRDAIDVLLGCLDTLEGAVDDIEAHGEESLDPAALIERLQGLVRERTPEQSVELRQGGSAPAPDAVAELAAGRRVVHVTAHIDEGAAMTSVRAFQVLAAVADHAEILASLPEEDKLEGFEGHLVEAWAHTESDEALLAAVRDVADVTEAVVVEEEVVAPPPAAVALSVVEAREAEGAAAAAAPDKAQATNHQTKGASTVRVDAERLDALMHHMAELVVQRTHVEALVGQADVPGLSQAMQDLTRSSQALQAMVMQVRMIPVESVFLRFPRLVRDLSSKLDKEVELVLVGQDTELDRTVVDALGDPLVHLVRNSLDHGFESPEDRVAAGKPRVGTLEISARHAGGGVVITVRDDGRGVNPAKVAAKAVERGIITPEAAAGVDAAAACELLFAPGFSTAEVTSDISGRGVGMDAVRTKIRELGGEAVLTSEPGQGSVAQIRLPLTLAIMSALLIRAAEGIYAVPIDRIDRTVRLADHTVRSAAGARMLVLREEVLPVVDAAEVLARAEREEAGHAVILRAQDGRGVALGVNGLIGQRELVTRPLPPGIADGTPVSGAAVLSDGAIALLVDCDALTTDHHRGPAALAAA